MRASIAALKFAFVALTGTALAGIAFGGAQAAPAGWTMASDHAQKCQAQVPGSWVPGEYHLGMKDPAGTSTVLISSSGLNNLGMAKQVVTSTYTVKKTFEDTPSRYWMAYTSGMGGAGTHWYVAVTTGSYICAMQLDLDAKISDADARTIALSLKKH
ncbi:MAG: hypothetical protein ABSC92_12005 [Rhizomicrobium sp.]|jgi:hypothetical protein